MNRHLPLYRGTSHEQLSFMAAQQMEHRMYLQHLPEFCSSWRIALIALAMVEGPAALP